MGLVISKIFPKPKKIVMVGLDVAGKTTIVYKLNLEPAQVIPTICSGRETVKYKNLELDVFDLGGQEKMRAFWRNFFESADGVIFVVDSQDKERGEVAAEELRWVSSELAAEKPILIFSNKQDLRDIMDWRKSRKSFVRKI